MNNEYRAVLLGNKVGIQNPYTGFFRMFSSVADVETFVDCVYFARPE